MPKGQIIVAPIAHGNYSFSMLIRFQTERGLLHLIKERIATRHAKRLYDNETSNMAPGFNSRVQQLHSRTEKNRKRLESGREDIILPGL